jgi:hypothetical protein
MSGNALVFCANLGRVGSRYLAALLGSSNEAFACHEPEPKMIDEYLTLINRHSYGFSYRARKIKCEAIRKALLDLPHPKSVYCDDPPPMNWSSRHCQNKLA